MSLMGAKFDRAAEGQKSTGSELERKYWPAMAAYAILAVVAWFMIGGGTVLIGGKAVEIRVLPLIVFALMAFRTYMARLADRMRRSSK